MRLSKHANKKQRKKKKLFDACVAFFGQLKKQTKYNKKKEKRREEKMNVNNPHTVIKNAWALRAFLIANKFGHI